MISQNVWQPQAEVFSCGFVIVRSNFVSAKGVVFFKLDLYMQGLKLFVSFHLRGLALWCASNLAHLKLEQPDSWPQPVLNCRTT